MTPEYEEKKLIDNAAFFAAVKETLDSGLEVTFTVTGMSMWPFFTSRRDSVVVRKCTFEEIKKGDIVLFSPVKNTYLLHRVIKKTDKNFITAGDGNTSVDGTFTPDKIIARVSCFSRKGKEYSVYRKDFRFLSGVWMCLFPVRKPILTMLKKIAMK